MLLGEKINHYEANTNETLLDFNTVFNAELEGDLSETVLISEPKIGGLYDVTIGEKVTRVNFNTLTQEKLKKRVYCKDSRMSKQLYTVEDKAGKVTKIIGIKALMELVKGSGKSVYRYINTDKRVSGYLIKDGSRIDEIKDHSEYNYSISKIRNVYSVVKDGVESSFRNIGLLSSFVGSNNKHIVNCIELGKLVNGYEITKTALTKEQRETYYR
jgi:hypothetical protein